MKSNPFSNDIFTNCWLRHFYQGRPALSFDWITPISFVRKIFLPYFVNTGSRFTKGLEYKLAEENHLILPKGVYLIYDVLTYTIDHEDLIPEGIGRMTVPQYKGYLIDLKNYTSLEGYLKQVFGKGSRYKLTKYKKKLETSFDIHYKMFWGDIEKSTYDEVFKVFQLLLKKRFDQKQVINNNLAPKEWAFYLEVAFPMILNKSACLFVVYDGNNPIAITLNFNSNKVVYNAITTFDTDYGKFHLGTVSLMALIDWCINNEIDVLDLSKGEFEYKKNWATRDYQFENHIFYNNQSGVDFTIAIGLALFFKIKQKLRDWKFNYYVQKIGFKLRGSYTKIPVALKNYSLIEVTEEINPCQSILIEPGTTKYNEMKIALFEFLYLYSENSKETAIFQIQDHPQVYLLKGAHKQAIMHVSPK